MATALVLPSKKELNYNLIQLVLYLNKHFYKFNSCSAVASPSFVKTNAVIMSKLKGALSWIVTYFGKFKFVFVG